MEHDFMDIDLRDFQFFAFLSLFTDKLVPLPSLFFIGKTGTPIEIVTSVTKTVEELKSKIDKVLNLVKPATSNTAAASSANLISSMLS